MAGLTISHSERDSELNACKDKKVPSLLVLKAGGSLRRPSWAPQLLLVREVGLTSVSLGIERAQLRRKLAASREGGKRSESLFAQRTEDTRQQIRARAKYCPSESSSPGMEKQRSLDDLLDPFEVQEVIV